MMVRVSEVWDEATDVLAARTGAFAALAALAFVLPAVVAGAVQAFGSGGAAAAAAGGLVAIAGVVLSLWGHLAVVALASEPVTRGEAARHGWRRLPAALLMALVIGGLVAVLLVPVLLILLASGFDVMAASAAASSGTAMPRITPGAGIGLFLYALLVGAVALWISARLFVIYPVVLHERLGVGAFGRSLALTRGLTVQLIGVVLLFGVGGLVAAAAAQFVTGVLARVLIGGGGVAGFAGGVAWSCVTAAWIVVVQAFAARLYRALTAGAGRGA